MEVKKLEEIRIINKDGGLEAYVNEEKIDLSESVSVSLEMRIEEDGSYLELFTKNRKSILVTDPNFPLMSR